MPATMSFCSTSCRRGTATGTRSPRVPSRGCSRTIPRPSWTGRTQGASPPATSRPSASPRRRGLDRRSGNRTGRSQAGRLSPDRFGAQDGLDRVVQYLDHPVERFDRRDAGELRARLPHHPFLQPAALHAAAGSCGGPGRAGGRGRRRFPASRISGSARASSGARTRQASSRPHRHVLAGRRHGCGARRRITVEEADALLGRPIGAPKTASSG